MAKDLVKILSLLIFVAYVSCVVTKRNVNITAWPDCDSYCEKAKNESWNVIYAEANSTNDNLLYAFSTIGMPTIVLARVTGNGRMHFNWSILVSNSSLEDAITIIGPDARVEYMFGAALTRLIEYNDTDDSADLEQEEKKYGDAAHWKIRDFKFFKWNMDTSSLSENKFAFIATAEHADVNTTIENNSTVNSNWSISFTFTVPSVSGRSSELPSLKYGVNETLFDFVIANYTPSFHNSRFAVEAVLVSRSTSEMNIETTNSIDDEYSPGVFQTITWLSDPKQEQFSGFFQWKPVCYNSKDRSRNAATQVKHYDLKNLTNHKNITVEFLNSSLIIALFGQNLYNEKNIIIRTANISFGLSEDGTYTKTNYTAWTAAIGYGIAPVDTISLTVIIIISAGLGLPVLILIAGAIYSCVRTYKRRRRAGFEPINPVSRGYLQVN